MADSELPWVFTEPLEQAEVAYMIVGAYATLAFGVHRTTDDLDVVLRLHPESWAIFATAFPEAEFYRPPRETFLEETARESRGHFKLIHQATQNRSDCYVAGREPLQWWGLKNRRRVEVEGRGCWVAPPELVILKKLKFFREGESPKHVRDVQEILHMVPEIDRAFIEKHVDRLGLREQWLVCQPPGA
jgi:hypothetical protein